MYLIGRKSMKKNVFKVLLVSSSLLLACGYTVNAESLERPEDRTELEKANDFDEETNIKEDFRGYTFQIPSSWGESENSSIFLKQYYAETGPGTSMFQIDCESLFDNFEELDQNKETAIELYGSSFSDFEAVETSEYEVCGNKGILYDFNGSISDSGIDVDFVGNMIVFVDDRSSNTFLISMLNSTQAEYSHFDDFYKIVDSIVERSGSASTEANTNDVPLEYGNALKAAKNYLEYTAFSYTGLISQLEYEGYSTEACTYAVDNCNADWNEQALNSAINYIEYTAFSYSGLISQLEYEGFTSDQATYGADNCGADWNEQAANAAKNYLEYSSFSRQGLLDQLIYEGFTQEQAEYGVASVGY